ncbi:MAG TPA: RNA polymerase sigma factor [Actinobacteria bacterium]|nr:RNA polymerase sigma factor [Actinomycetota bacterium]
MSKSLQFESLSDEELAKQAASGSADHFEIIVHRYSGAMYRVAYSFCHNTAEAQDLTQETFVKLFKALPKAKLDLPFKPWLYKIAINNALSHIRKKQEKHQVDWTETETTLASDDPTDAIVKQNDLQIAIDKLPFDYQQMIILRAVEELSFEEISGVLDIPAATARTKFSRAKKQLRAILSSRE